MQAFHRRLQPHFRRQTVRGHVQRFLFLQFLLRWLAVGLWILFTVLAYRVSFYTSREQLNLRLATGLSAGFLGVVCIALGSLLHAVWKTFSSQQHWCVLHYVVPACSIGSKMCHRTYDTMHLLTEPHWVLGDKFERQMPSLACQCCMCGSQPIRNLSVLPP